MQIIFKPACIEENGGFTPVVIKVVNGHDTTKLFSSVSYRTKEEALQEAQMKAWECAGAIANVPDLITKSDTNG